MESFHMQAMQLIQNQELEGKNHNMFYLWWYNKKSQKKFCAGRAFYSEKQGDFRLFINLLENSSNGGKREEYYLRPAQVSDDYTYFKVEKIIHHPDRSHRFWVGEAFRSVETNGDIHIQIEPLTGFYKKLVLNMNQEKDKNHE